MSALETLFNTSLAVLMGNMKQILCSDWLPHFACLRLPTLFPCMKNVAWSRLTMVVTFGQCGQWSCKKQQKTIKTKTYTTRSPGFIVLQTQLPSFMALQLNKSFLILDKEKSFCYKIYLLLTMLVKSWLLDISLILFCVFLRTSTFSQSIKSHKKEFGQYPGILTSPLVNNAYIRIHTYLTWPINIINYDNKPNYLYLFIF